MDYAPEGVTWGGDWNGGFSDQFDTATGMYGDDHHHKLAELVNVGTVLMYFEHDFDEVELGLLIEYNDKGSLARFGLGFDPDCPFSNTGIKLTIETSTAVPEPCTMLLVGSGLLGLLGFRRKFRRS